MQDGILGDGDKVLALTFMNGARRRLDARLRENPLFRGRFDCQTFDVFARTLAARRRSLVTQTMQEQAAPLNEFDGPCAVAALLLENQPVRQWVARGFPLVLIDEAQDLDAHRMRVLQALSQSCRIVAAADAFQCLHDGRDTAPLIGWLENAGADAPPHPASTYQSARFAGCCASSARRKEYQVHPQSEPARAKPDLERSRVPPSPSTRHQRWTCRMDHRQ